MRNGKRNKNESVVSLNAHDNTQCNSSCFYFIDAIQRTQSETKRKTTKNDHSLFLRNIRASPSFFPPPIGHACIVVAVVSNVKPLFGHH